MSNSMTFTTICSGAKCLMKQPLHQTTRPRFVLQYVDFQCFMEWSVELWPKNGCDSTLGVEWYLIINEL